MANYRNEIVTELKPVWDLRISGIDDITLILCGSIAAFMKNKVVKSNAFFGRTDLVIHLKNFLLADAKEMLKGKGIIEIIEAQMLLGGIPQYLDLVREKLSIRIGLEELAFTGTGYLVDEYERIFLSHFGKNPEYEKIVRILARQAYGLFRQQISEMAGVDLGGGMTTHLKNLESAGFIVITLCEMKYSLSPIGMDVIEEVERKAEIINNKFKKKTVQKVLISSSKPTKDLVSCGFFYRIINPEEFF